MDDRNQRQLDEARKEFDLLTDIAKQIRVKLEEERNSPPDPEQVQQAVSHCAEQVSSLKSKLTRHKQLSKQRQEEIQSWQSWLEGVDPEDMSNALVQLDKEVSWRQKDISQQEQLIGELYNQIHLTEAEKLEKEAQLAAISNGLLDVAVDEDPRLTGLLEERDALQEKIKTLQQTQ